MKKALRFHARLSLVAGIGEISNFDLVKEIAYVVDYMSIMEY